MNNFIRSSCLLTAFVGAALTMCAAARSHAQAVTPVRQNPSPMVETTRRHERLPPFAANGERFSIEGVLANPVHVFVPEAARTRDTIPLLVHFHGAAYVAEHAVTAQRPLIVAVVNLGEGSGVYEQAFAADGSFNELYKRILQELNRRRARNTVLSEVVLSGYSAGCAAVRAILRDNDALRQIEAVALLDGLHTSYVPEGRVLAEAGSLDTSRLESVAHFAELAVKREKRLIVSHSEIFPGTFASTTETADWLLRELKLQRRAVLEWGPVGMQRVSTTQAGSFRLDGYVGNTAPDHVDHLHSLPAVLAALQR